MVIGMKTDKRGTEIMMKNKIKMEIEVEEIDMKVAVEEEASVEAEIGVEIEVITNPIKGGPLLLLKTNKSSVKMQIL